MGRGRRSAASAAWSGSPVVAIRHARYSVVARPIPAPHEISVAGPPFRPAAREGHPTRSWALVGGGLSRPRSHRRDSAEANQGAGAASPTNPTTPPPPAPRTPPPRG